MAKIWQHYRAMNDVSELNEREFDAMARVLEAKHGLHAAEVAEFFACLHIDKGDETRSHAWADVAERVRERERKRIAG
jgi:hypothetical protein